MSQGLNQQEVKELVEYIKENNSWYNMNCCSQGRKTPKYYTMSYDTRTNDMWRICFYEIIGAGYSGSRKEEVIFRTEYGTDLKQRIYDWLDEEYKEGN